MSQHLPTSVHHIGIVVQDLEASIAWYRDMLGFTEQHRFGWPGVKAAFIGRGGVRLELFENEAAAPLAAERKERESNLRIGGLNHVALAVDDLEATLAELSAKGVETVSPPREVPGSGGDRYAFIRDHEGMLVELFEPA